MKLATVRKLALSLPEVTEQPHHDHASFCVRGKIFMTVPPAEDAIHLFVTEEDRERALAMYPDWTEKLLWGAKVAGLRVLLETGEPAAIRSLVGQAHAAKAGRARAAPA